MHIHGGSWVGATMTPEGQDNLKGQACLGCKRNGLRPLTQLAHIDFLDEQIETLNRAIEVSLSALSVDAPSGEEKAPRPITSHVSPPVASPTLTFTRAVALLDTIPGIDQRGAEVIVAEVGIDMSRFETAPRLAAWAGVAPGNDESAGKQRSGKTRKGIAPSAPS